MSYEDVGKELGVNLKKGFTIKGEYIANAEQTIGGNQYSLSLLFDPKGLKKVTVEPKEKYQSFGSQVKVVEISISRYDEFKKALTAKFGPPKSTTEVDRGADAVLINNILNHTAVLNSQWVTPESTITLTVEARLFTSPANSGGRPVYTISPFLVYAKADPNAKPAEEIKL
jgi:hypothetical protein